MSVALQLMYKEKQLPMISNDFNLQKERPALIIEADCCILLILEMDALMKRERTAWISEPEGHAMSLFSCPASPTPMHLTNSGLALWKARFQPERGRGYSRNAGPSDSCLLKEEEDRGTLSRVMNP